VICAHYTFGDFHFTARLTEKGRCPVRGPKGMMKNLPTPLTYPTMLQLPPFLKIFLDKNFFT